MFLQVTSIDAWTYAKHISCTYFDNINTINQQSKNETESITNGIYIDQQISK